MRACHLLCVFLLALLTPCLASAAAPPASAPAAPVVALVQPPLEPIARLLVDRDHDTVPDRRGQRARVRGVVTLAPAALSDRFFEVTIQDASGGIALYSRTLRMPLAVGDLVEAEGFVNQYAGMVQLQNVTVTRLAHQAPPAPLPIALSDADGWKHMGMRVRVEALAGPITLDHYGRMRLDGDDGSSISLYVSPVSLKKFDWKAYPRGAHLSVVGVVSIHKVAWPYDGGFQLLVTDPADITIVAPPPPAWQAWLLRATLAMALLLSVALGVFYLLQMRQRAREREIATLAALSAAFASGNLTQEQLARHACDILTAFAVVDAALVHVFDENGALRQLAVSASDMQVARSLNSPEPLPPGDPAGNAHRRHVESLITGQGLALLGVHPLLALSGTQGFLVALGPPRRKPSAMQERTLHSAVKLLAMALEIRRNEDRAAAEQRELQQLVVTDELTRLYNRRFLDEYLRVQMPLAERRGGGIAFVLIDIDHFKSVNDSLGHDVGDTILAGVAAVLRQSSRGSDVPVRLGGEEFLIVIPESDAEGALTVAERVRTAVQAEAFEHTAQGQARHVTVSVGVSVFGLHGNDAATLLRAADEAMYASKRAGRNRVTLAESVVPV